MSNLENFHEDVPELVVTTGRWGDVPWQFIATSREPDATLCNAAFCVVTYQGRLILPRHITRGYEFAGGHVESGESMVAAVVREVREEAQAVISNPQFFGYKKTSPSQPVPYRDQPGHYYPFPHSYVPYYFAEASCLLEDAQLPSDITSVRLASYEEALALLRADQNHSKILDYLVTQGLIALGDKTKTN